MTDFCSIFVSQKRISAPIRRLLLVIIVTAGTALAQPVKIEASIPINIGDQKPFCDLQADIAQMLMVSPLKPVDFDALAAEARRFGLGGMIVNKWMFAEAHNREQVKEIISRLQKDREPKMWIAVDQEGGEIQTLGPEQGFTALASAENLGKANDPLKTEGLARLAGNELKEVGINWNLAPVVDVAINLKETSLLPFHRMFSSNPSLTAKLGAAFIRGLHGSGILATAKHYPGLGGGELDTHHDSSVIDYDRAQWELAERKTFSAAVSSGVDAVMVSHATYPKLFGSMPASLNPSAIDELRQGLRFTGIIMTDVLNMGAIARQFRVREIFENAVLAGNDVMLVTSGTEQIAMRFLCEGVNRTDTRSAELRKRILAAAERLRLLKSQRFL